VEERSLEMTEVSLGGGRRKVMETGIRISALYTCLVDKVR